MNALDFTACIQKLYEKQMEPVSRSFELTAMELNILLFLANNPEYDTAGSIVERRHLTKSHVSVSVRALEERGLIRKEHRNGDRRTAHLVLMPSASAVIAAGRDAQAVYMAALTSGLTDEEIQIMKRCMDRMGGNALRGLREV